MGNSSIEEGPKISRRTALKAAVGLGVSALVGKRAEGELSVVELGIDTTNGIFFPIYEKHTTPTRPEDLPPNIDYFFQELVMNKANYDLGSADMAKQLFYDDVQGKLVDERDLFNHLIKNNIEIAFGDTYVPVDRNYLSQGRKFLSRENLEFMARLVSGVALAVGGVTQSELSKIDDEVYGRKSSTGKILRRGFLKYSMLGIGATLAVPQFLEEPLRALSMKIDEPAQKTAISRIVHRLQGILSNFRPEDAVVFFRNLVMSNKLLFLAQEGYATHETKQRIAYNLGSLHSGIEDMLVAGQDFCRALITLYPKEFLQEVVDINGGVENFCSIKLIGASDKVRFEDLDNPVAKQYIGDIRIFDGELQEALKQKLILH